MMIQEFTKLTGIDPTTEEYAVIEELYYNFDGDKRAFCKEFVETNMMDAVRKQIISNLHEELTQVYNKLRKEARESAILAGEIERLKADLEREQEWKPWENEKALKQNQYDALAKDGSSHEMTDEEAKEWISNEFGFAPGKIQINRQMKVYEVSRHDILRQVGEIDRRPFYDATDWYYVFFTVCGLEYEAYNGSLTQL